MLPFVLAIVLYLLLSPMMRFLSHRLRLPRTVAALVLILALFCLSAASRRDLRACLRLIARAPESLPTLEKKLGFLRAPINMAQNGLKQLGDLMGEERPTTTQPPAPSSVPTMSNLGSVGGAILLGTGAALGKVFTVLLLLFFCCPPATRCCGGWSRCCRPGEDKNARCKSPSRSSATSPAISRPSR